MNPSESIKDLMQIPGIGKSISMDLISIGITAVNDLIGKDPEMIYRQSNAQAGKVQDRCLLYSFRCAVYFAETKKSERDPEKLKWWNWKDNPPEPVER